jgi:pimeloyl-ACP methyl ester carboxylesterase
VSVRRIRSGRIGLALHELAGGEGTPLLLLHALGGSSRDWGEDAFAWPGPAFALDFAGHGESDRHRGGSYHLEHFVSGADLALSEVGPAALAGAGAGAWYAVILAGARPDRVPGVLLAPGAGLEGVGPEPDPLDVRRRIPTDAEAAASPDGCDPYVRGVLGEPRPPRFVAPFARAAHRVLLVEDGSDRPPWWETVRECGGQPAGADLAAGLAALAAAVRERA